MANLRADLLNEFRNQKYYAEMELVRLAQEPNMNYKNKIDKIAETLEKISVINQQIGLADAYFQAPEQQVQAPQVGEPIVGQPEGETVQVAQPLVHQGQSHGE